MTWLDLITTALAGSAIIDVWFRGSLFAGARRRVVAFVPQTPITEQIKRLITCPFCLSYHVWLLVIWGLVPGLLWPDLLAYTMLPLYALAATRIMTLLDGALPSRQRHAANDPFEVGGGVAGDSLSLDEAYAALGKMIADGNLWQTLTRELTDDEARRLGELWPMKPNSR